MFFAYTGKREGLYESPENPPVLPRADARGDARAPCRAGAGISRLEAFACAHALARGYRCRAHGAGLPDTAARGAFAGFVCRTGELPAASEEDAAPEEPSQNAPAEPSEPLTFSPEEADAIVITGGCTYTYEKQALLMQPSTLDFSGDGPKILIVHTHATESYLPSSEGNYHRKGRLNTVRDAGDVLAETLDKEGIPCVHDSTLHDEKSYNQAYSRSYETTEALLKKYPSIECVIDLHRDAVPGKVSVATVSIGGKKCAKYSYVVSNAVETYASNLSFVRKMNETAMKNYDGFTGNILERGYRYNQNLSSKYMLLEIGYNRNDIEEVRNTAEYFGKILAETLKKGN